jgi:hypothetical protein
MIKAVLRATSILTDPFHEWGLIERETDDPAFVLGRYVALLAIIPSLFGFIGVCLIGVTAKNGTTIRSTIVDGLFGAVFAYVAACATVLVIALIIHLLAPLFGGRRGFDGAFKLAVYSFTPVWLAGIFLILPGLHFLALLGFYGLYILWLGLPRLSKVPEEMSLTFAVVIAACAGLLIYAAVTVQHTMFGTPGL